MNKSKNRAAEEDTFVRDDGRHAKMLELVSAMKDRRKFMGGAYLRSTSLAIGDMARVHSVPALARVYGLQRGYVRTCKKKAEIQHRLAHEKAKLQNVANAAEKLAEEKRAPMVSPFASAKTLYVEEMPNAPAFDADVKTMPGVHIEGKMTLVVTPAQVVFIDANVPGLSISIPVDSDLSIRAVARMLMTLSASIKK